MSQLPDYEVTPGQLPVDLEGEVRVYSCGKVQVSTAENMKKNVIGGRTVLEIAITTHRVLFTNRKKSFFKMVHLNQISSQGTVIIKSGLFKKPSAKLQFDTKGIGMYYLQFPKKSDCAAFHKKILQKVKDEGWVQKTMEDITKVEEEKKPAMGGILEIKRRIEKSEGRQDEALKAGFQDIDSLMEKANELVVIAEKLSQQQLNQEDDKELQGLLQEVGITKISGVTKSGSGSKFTEDLSRELCDFLQNILERNKGMVPLTDVYMIYNRARGTDLVSPEDVLKACNMFDKLRLPLELRHFKDSKVKIVMDRSRNKEEINKLMFQLIDQDPKKRASVVSVAKGFDISLLLAKIILEDAEINEELIIRDEAPGGNVYFYKNYFLKLSPLDYKQYL